MFPVNKGYVRLHTGLRALVERDVHPYLRSVRNNEFIHIGVVFTAFHQIVHVAPHHHGEGPGVCLDLIVTFLIGLEAVEVDGQLVHELNGGFIEGLFIVIVHVTPYYAGRLVHGQVHPDHLARLHVNSFTRHTVSFPHACHYETSRPHRYLVETVLRYVHQSGIVHEIEGHDRLNVHEAPLLVADEAGNE